MSLRYAKQLGAPPFLMKRFDIDRGRDEIEFAQNEEHTRGVAQRFGMRWRAEMKMPSHQLRRDLCPLQLPPHGNCCRILPDRVFDIRNRRHESEKTEIAFDGREQSADPRAVACSKNSKVQAAAFPQGGDQLA